MLNENPKEVVIRKIYEETGIKIIIVRERKPKDCDFILLPLTIQKNMWKKHIHMDYVYATYLDGNNKLTLNEDKSRDIEWFSIE